MNTFQAIVTLIALVGVVLFLVFILFIDLRHKWKYRNAWWNRDKIKRYQFIWWGRKGLKWGNQQGFYLNEKTKLYKYWHLGFVQIRGHYVQPCSTDDFKELQSESCEL